MQEFFQLIADKGHCDKNALESIFNSVVIRCKKEIEESQLSSPPVEEKPAPVKEVILPEPVIHFDSKLDDIMMHADKPVNDIVHAYEKITPTRVRVIPPSMKPTLNIGDQVRYNNGKQQCKGTISKIVKDSAILSNVHDSSSAINTYMKEMKYMYKLS